MVMGAGNPFLGFLEDEPRAGYFGYQNQWRTPSQKRYFQSQFSNIQDQYMGQLGQQAMRGQEPTQSWMDFLGKFPWQQEFQGLTPQQRGQDNSRFNPFTKWLTG